MRLYQIVGMCIEKTQQRQYNTNRIYLEIQEVIPMAMVTKSTTIGEVLARDINTAQFFINIGMHCLGCPHSQGESIEEACMVHGTDADQLVEEINNYFQSIG